MPNAQTTKQKNRPAFAGWLIGFAAVWAAAAGLVYFWRVVFLLPPAFPAGLATLGVGTVFSLLYSAVFCLCRLKTGNISLKAAILVFVAGLLFCFATAPLQAPDENKHFLRANSISRGRFTYQYTETYPDDVAHLLDVFEAPMNHKVAYQGAQLAPDKFEEYLARTQSGTAPDEAAEPPVMFLLLPFLHEGLFMAVARLFGFGALGQLYAGRIANLLLYAVLCYFTFQNCRRFRGVFITFALLPVSLFMAASCSYDGLMLALCYFALSFLCRDEIKNDNFIAFMLAVGMANYIKPLNFLLAAVLLFIPKERFKLTFKWKDKRVLWAAAAALFAVTFWFGIEKLDTHVLKQGWPDLARGSGEAADTGGQMGFILRYPLRFAAVVLQSVYEADGFLFDLGRLGAMDTVLPLIGGLSVLVLGAGAALSVPKEKALRTSAIIGLCAVALLYTGAVLGGMYVADTDLGSIRITGPQPRYFLPAFLLLFLAGSALLSKVLQPRALANGTAFDADRLTMWLAAGLAVFCAVLLFQNYFVGQWLPKAEGGWKLVNLYGWVQT